MSTILIMAGGTGGHVFPGLAVADEMRRRGWQVVWMGARSGMEARLVPAHGYPVAWIRAAALRGKGLAAQLLLPLNLLVGFWQSARAILHHRPDVVLGMGGYVAFPGGMMASLLARPLAVHEQNAIAGLTNRVLAGLADRTLTAFPGGLKNAEWTGNPVRAEIAAIADPATRYGTGPWIRDRGILDVEGIPSLRERHRDIDAVDVDGAARGVERDELGTARRVAVRLGDRRGRRAGRPAAAAAGLEWLHRAHGANLPGAGRSPPSRGVAFLR